jgi:hypothetical protein
LFPFTKPPTGNVKLVLPIFSTNPLMKDELLTFVTEAPALNITFREKAGTLIIPLVKSKIPLIIILSDTVLTPPPLMVKLLKVVAPEPEIV